jgi:hypothetical protein
MTNARGSKARLVILIWEGFIIPCQKEEGFSKFCLLPSERKNRRTH